ncbi:hypothetical protein O181_044145 [Austropuccinia psidii MF-1]|uniref:tRNA pseudouridine(55) synthase n=1 Tax=Austropuccinia psidii MF-1 TaxID=1389203 RepID=A0A9Q3HJW5_9BASI|nr:hypothetical protein [Austropuccinia psidii MF-1]
MIPSLASIARNTHHQFNRNFLVHRFGTFNRIMSDITSFGHTPSSQIAARLDYKVPLSGLFAINKPSGVISMSLLESLKSLFLTSKLFVKDTNEFKNIIKNRNFKRKKQHQILKIGQGGTLDPLASGVLVIGLNSATKKLSQFLHCTKTYKTVGLLGCQTDSYDSQGKVVRLANWRHVTDHQIQKSCQSIKGKNRQIPPIYSALKMDGKPLYEYARENIPLPRPIEARDCEILDIKMTDWQEGGTQPQAHSYKWPSEMCTDQEIEILEKTSKLINSNKAPISPATDTTSATKRPAEDSEEEVNSKKIKITPTDHNLEALSHDLLTTKQPQDIQVSMDDNGLSPAFTIEMTVSSGTYVRTIVHDIGKAVSSAATVVSLIRTRQGDFALNPNEGVEPYIGKQPCIEWQVFEKAIKNQEEGREESPSEVDGLKEWERQLLQNIKSEF